MRVFDFNSALVRTPSASAVNGLRATPGPPVDFTALLHEHQTYTSALQSAGAQITTLPPLDAFPDSLFLEDPALVFSHAAILLRPGAPTRVGESEHLFPVLNTHFPTVLRLTQGFADGGDILVTPREILIGLSSRTDPTGASQLQSLLHSLNLTSRIVSVPAQTLHLKTDCSLIDEETILATDSLATSGLFDGYRVLTVPSTERAATNAVRINDHMLMRANCPRTLDLLSRHGVNPVPLPTDEIAKIDAGLSCMSLRWFDPR